MSQQPYGQPGYQQGPPPQPQQQYAPPPPQQGFQQNFLCVTTNDIPGYRIDAVYGEVFGLTVRSRNAFSQMGAGLKSMFGGELKGMTKALMDSRNDVMQRMIQEAMNRGANAIVGMRFDTSEMGDVWTEICAYGTAVTISRQA
ncbi:YbjQ family protein [Catenulispora rubra]|uniref:YbjQ family protein n=1 Tax=Catenulispora rubra TaxID=280293 RepID=UPI0018926BA7|nr:YbjQ family protein [Catenulispora rubra]